MVSRLVLGLKVLDRNLCYTLRLPGCRMCRFPQTRVYLGKTTSA